MAEQTPRGLTFGAVSERYERYRPGYPADVVDLLLAQSPAAAVEVGAGTGKATREVAARGVAVTAVEPDAGMVAVLRRTTQGLPVTVVESTFEAMPAQQPVDLLYAAAAFHWTDPATRWQRAADLLRPGGVFACLGAPIDLADPDLSRRVEELRARTLGDELTSGARSDADGRPWPAHELEATPLFTDVRVVDLPTTYPMPADDFVGLLSTVSAFLVAAEEDRDDLLRRIRSMLPDPVEVRRELRVHLARRSQTGTSSTAPTA